MGIKKSVRSVAGVVQQSPGAIRRSFTGEDRDSVVEHHLAELHPAARAVAATGFRALELGQESSGLPPRQRRGCLEAALADCVGIELKPDASIPPAAPVLGALIGAIEIALEENRLQDPS